MPRTTQALDFVIPLDLLKEFQVKPRIIIRDRFINGIPVPDVLLQRGFGEKIRAAGFEVMLVPKATLK